MPEPADPAQARPARRPLRGRRAFSSARRAGLPALILAVTLTAVGLPTSGAGVAVPATPAEPIGRTLTVPLDYRAPSLGTGTLYYELGAPFDPDKPTVLIIADGQQFYLRKGTVADLQRELLGDRFNVAGIVGRGFSDDIQEKAIPDPEHVDWAKAYQVFKSEQWVEDIDAVRRDLVGKRGQVLVYGASGGGFLAHQYLAAHGRFVRRAFTQCAVMRQVEADLRLAHDHFWSEIGGQEPALQRKLLQVLRAQPERRPEIIQLLQRQNFFVAPERLAEERAKLIEDLSNGAAAAVEKRKEEYQVNALAELMSSRTGAPIRVRIYESVEPLAARLDLSADAVYPNLENEYHIARPLLTLRDAAKIPPPAFDLAALRDLDTEVFILAGRLDHTVDYRSQIALASSYRNRLLFIADDNHMFVHLKEGGVQERLLRAFLLHGLRSPEMQQALEGAEPLRWVEKD